MADSECPIMWDIIQQQSVHGSAITFYNHAPGGANVLFMDGHVEFLKYPSTKLPATTSVANVAALW